MTGFADASAESRRRRFEVTIQGWNHRHFDDSIRLPEELAGREAGVRERLAGAVARGRCAVTVRVRATADGAPLAIDRDGLARLRAAARQLEAEGLLEAKLTLGDVLRTPQLLVVAAEAAAWEADDESAFESALARAVSGFQAARSREGERLGEALQRDRVALGEVVQRLDARRATVAGQLEATVRERLDALLAGSAQALPADRLAQEIVLLADRSDVREEIDRLRAHLAHLDEVFAAAGAIGRRLDFLAQEILRELNTLGAKCRDVELTRLVVDAKVICEQLREQAQNVE